MISRSPTTIRVPSGWFWMGSNDHYEWESPRHRVFLRQFEISTTTVTRSEYATFLREAGHPEPRDWENPLFADPTQAVVGVSWFDAVSYCAWISAKTGRHHRLPSEAEWEKACRGGSDDWNYAWGNEEPDSLEYFHGEWSGPRRVGESSANGFGLFNMGENVHEWCADWYAPDYYATSPKRNPGGPESGTRRVSRGGSWRHSVKGSRCAHRSSLPPGFRYTDYGFRLVSE